MFDSKDYGRLGIAHLKRFWSQTIDGRNGLQVVKTESDNQLNNLVLSSLNLPLEPTINYLSQNAPSFDEFEKWIAEQNSGTLDASEIERFNSRLNNQPYSENLQNSITEIEESEDVLTAEDLRFWKENGYVVVRRAVTKAQAKAAEEAVWNHLGMSALDAATWYEKPIGKGIMTELYRHPALDETRRAPRIKKAFAQIWKTADLWTTTDRTSFNPPEIESFKFQGPNLHWDMSLASPHSFGTQGLLYLCDTPAEQGAFSCVPKFHKRLAGWLNNLPENVNPREVDLTNEAVPITAEAGDFVIWHQALPHGSSPNRGKYPRIVQYLNMYPFEFRENLEWL